MKKVKLKSVEQLQKLRKEGKITMTHVGGDMSETVAYGIGNKFIPFHYLDHEKEFMVIDYPHLLSSGTLEGMELLFEESNHLIEPSPLDELEAFIRGEMKDMFCNLTRLQTFQDVLTKIQSMRKV